MNTTRIRSIIQKVGRNTHLLEKQKTWTKLGLDELFLFLKNQHRSIRETIYLILNDTIQPSCKNPNCKNIPNFISLSKGYNGYCSKSCGVKCQTTDRSSIGKKGMVSKRKLALVDEDYFKKSSPSSVLYWVNRGRTEEEAIEEVSKFQRKFSLDICIEKYGLEEGTMIWEQRQIKWQETLNSKSPEEKERINENKNCFKNKSHQEITEIKMKRRETAEQNGVWTPLDDVEDFKLYRMKVWSFTRNQPLNLIKNIEKRGHISNTEQAYHLDHKFSISEGFKRGILPIYIGSIANLEMLPARDNISKNSKCSVSEADLFETFQRP